MAITLKNFKIINKGLQLQINVETNVGYVIDTLLFWKMNDFKNTALAISLSSYLLKTSNVETLTINAVDIGLEKFEDLCFIEITSTFPNVDSCGNLLSPAIGITYDLSQYYGCLLKYLLEIPLDYASWDIIKVNQMVITMNMLIDTTIKSVDIGYYTEAIDMVNSLKKLCSISNSVRYTSIECPTCTNFVQI